MISITGILPGILGCSVSPTETLHENVQSAQGWTNQAMDQGPSQQGFGQQINRIYVSQAGAAQPITGVSVGEQLHEIALRENFQLHILDETYKFIRDTGVILQGGEFLAVYDKQPTLLYARRQAALLGSLGLGDISQLLQSEINLQLDQLEQRTGLLRRNGHVFVEGGNMVVATRQDGSRIVIIGKGSLLMTTALLQAQGLFTAEVVNNMMARMTPSEYEVTQAKEQLQYLVQADRSVDHWSPREFYVRSRPGADASAFGIEVVEYYEDRVVSGDGVSQDAARRYLAKQELAKALIASELGVRVFDLVFVEQVFYHVDLFLLPGPDGIVFLQDDDDPMGPAPPARLHNMQLKLASVGYQLRKAGLRTVPVQGISYTMEAVNGQSQKSARMTTNFFNGIVGRSPLSERTINITNESPISYLNQHWEQLMSSYGVDSVYFLRHNLLEESAGVRCISWVD